MDMATEFATQIAKLHGYGDDDAGKLANQQVKGWRRWARMFRITKVDDNTISTSLQYANGQVTLNGDKMPLEDFVGMFGMLPRHAGTKLNQQRQPNLQRRSSNDKTSREGFFIAGWRRCLTRPTIRNVLWVISPLPNAPPIWCPACTSYFFRCAA